MNVDLDNSMYIKNNLDTVVNYKLNISEPWDGAEKKVSAVLISIKRNLVSR